MKQVGGPAAAAGLPHSVFPTFAAAQSCRILPNTNRQCRTPFPQIQAENERVLFDAAIRLQGEMILKKHNRFAGRALSLLCALCFLALLPAGCTPADEDVYGPTEKPGYPCENDEYTYLIHPESGEATITSLSLIHI